MHTKYVPWPGVVKSGHGKDVIISYDEIILYVLKVKTSS